MSNKSVKNTKLTNIAVTYVNLNQDIIAVSQKSVDKDGNISYILYETDNDFSYFKKIKSSQNPKDFDKFLYKNKSIINNDRPIITKEQNKTNSFKKSNKKLF